MFDGGGWRGFLSLRDPTSPERTGGATLRQNADQIGLNVKADNAAALTCYGRLGFEVVGEYEEFMVERTFSMG